jgi:hypothetical protein
MVCVVLTCVAYLTDIFICKGAMATRFGLYLASVFFSRHIGGKRQ